MSPDSASSTSPNQDAAGDTCLLPDMSRFEPAGIGAWACVWNSPYWFSAERDLEEGERVSVAVISDDDGATLCRLTFVADSENRLKDRWLAAIAAQINGDETATPWLRAGDLDGDDVFHEGPQTERLRLWCWGGRARIVCTAPFTGNLQPALALPDVTMDAGQTLWLQVRDRATQRVCETLEVGLSGDSWQRDLCASVNSRSGFVRVGMRGKDDLAPVPAAAGCSIYVPQLAALDITLDPFDPRDEAEQTAPQADPRGAYERHEHTKLDDPLHYRKSAGERSINLGSKMYVPVIFYGNVNDAPKDKEPNKYYGVKKFEFKDYYAYKKLRNKKISGVHHPAPQPTITYAICCKLNKLAQGRFMFTGGGDTFETEPLEKLFPFLTAPGRLYSRLINDEKFSFEDYVNYKYYFHPLSLRKHIEKTYSSAQVTDKNKILSIRQAVAGYYIKGGNNNSQFLPLWNLIKDAAADIHTIYNARNTCQLGGNVNIYCLSPLAGIGIFAPDGEVALPFSTTVVSRQRVSHALPVNADGYNPQRTPLSKVTSTLCEDAAFTLGSEVFDVSGETESGVDPLTGLYHAHYPLAALQSLTDPRVRLDLALHYAATRANEAALGDGWAFGRTSFDNRLRRLRHVSGRTFTLTEDNLAALGRGERLTFGDMTLSGELMKSSIKFSVLSSLTLRLSGGEEVTLGLPGNAEEAGEDHKLAVMKRLATLNANLKRLKAEQEKIAEEAGNITWPNGNWSPTHKKEEALRRANHYGAQIAANNREMDLYSTRAVVLVPVSIGRTGGAALTLRWDGKMGHVRLLSVHDGAQMLLSATHDTPVAAGRYASTFTVWPGTPEAYEVRLDIEDCLLKAVTRRPVGGSGGQTVRYGYCNDPLFDRLLDCVTGEDGAREFITWRSGLAADDGSWMLPAVLARTYLPGGEGQAMTEFWRWRGDVSLKPNAGGTRTATHTAPDGTVTVREWEYTAAGPRPVRATETRPDGTGSTSESQYAHAAGAAPHLQGLATRVTVTPSSPIPQAGGSDDGRHPERHERRDRPGFCGADGLHL